MLYVVLNGGAFRIEQCSVTFTVCSVVMTGIAKLISDASTVIGIWGEILQHSVRGRSGFPANHNLVMWACPRRDTRNGRRSIST